MAFARVERTLWSPCREELVRLRKTMARGQITRQPSKSGKQAGARRTPLAKLAAKKQVAPKRAPVAKRTPSRKSPTGTVLKAANQAAKGYNPLAPQRIGEILTRLDTLYPNVTCALHHKSAWELVVATILSAQCTDVRVNMVTPGLFAKYPSPAAFAANEPEELEPQIRSTGFFRNKAKSVVGAARKLMQAFGGVVPDDMDKLLTLPGVARKTANVVLGSWFGKAVGVVVDTHVHRISRRLELSTNDEPVKIEQDLMQVIPREKWILFSHQIIHHGRGLCIARKPKCVECPLENICHAGDKTWSTVDMHEAARL
jgi:endonuclease-3